jgi:hypothetical protein
LSLEERARLYRQHAAEAFRAAQLSEDGTVRAEHLAQAANWHHLADDIERSMRLAGLDPQAGGNPPQPGPHR